jgi:hypothetical protein
MQTPKYRWFALGKFRIQAISIIVAEKRQNPSILFDSADKLAP